MLEEISAIILGVSLASERLLELLKTLFPWLGIQKSSTDDNRERSHEEKLRRVVIQVVSFLSGWLTAGFVAAKADEWISLDGFIPVGEHQMPAMVVGLLSSGGSVFWTQIVSYSKAVKDLKKLEAQGERITTEKKNPTLDSKTQRKMTDVLASDHPDFD